MNFNYYILIIILLFISVIYFNFIISYGESPTFVRQEVDDVIGDLIDLDNSKSISKELDQCKKVNMPSVDIEGISYISDGEFLNGTVWLDRSFESYSSDIPSDNVRSNLVYDFMIINSSLTMSSLIKNVIDDLNSMEDIDSIELIPMKAEENENFKIIFNDNSVNTKDIWFLSIQNNTKYLHSFQIYDYDDLSRKYLPIVDNIIDSIKFIEDSNSTYAEYENPYFGVKFQYPNNLVKNSYISSFFPREFINDEHYNKWEPIFSVVDQNDTFGFEIFVKNKTGNFTLEDYKREMIEFTFKMIKGNKDTIINYTNDFELEKLLNIKTNYSYFKLENEFEFSEPSYSNIILTLISKDNKVYSFFYGTKDDRSFIQNLTLYNNIIDSIKFIEDSNSTYAEYENPYFGVKFQYPNNWKIDNWRFNPNKELTLTELFSKDSTPLNYVSFYPLTTFKSDDQSVITGNTDRITKYATKFDGYIYYYMLIDVSSVYDKGTDYAIQIQWNSTSSNWDRIFLELSSTAGARLLDIDYNISDFYNDSGSSKEIGADNFITFSVNLDMINNPDKYKIMFGAGARYNTCNMDDKSQLLPIPPPNYSIKPINNNQLILYPYDEKDIGIQINSDSPTSSTFYFGSKLNQDDRVNVTFSPDILTLNPIQSSVSNVKIITMNAKEGSHTIPIYANVTFPSEIQYTLNNVTEKVSNPISSIIPLKSNITVTVEPVPPFYQPVIDFIKNVIEPSAGFITATIIPIATAIFGLRVYFKRKHSSSTKKRKRNNVKKPQTE